MRKLAIWLSLLLLLMLAAAAALPLGLPGENLVAGPARRADGAVLTVENRELTARIYTQQDGSLTELYREFRWQDKKENSIARVATDGENTYFLRVSAEGDIWTLMQLEQKTASLVAVCKPESGLTATGLKARDGVVWVTGMADNGEIFVYEYTRDAGFSLKLIHSALWLQGASAAEYDGERVAITMEEGTHCYLSISGERSFDESAAQILPDAIRAEGTGWFLCKQVVLLVAGLLWLVIAVSVWITGWILGRAKRLATRLTALGGEILFATILVSVFGIFLMLQRAAGLTQAVGMMLPMILATVLLWLAAVLALRALSGHMTRPVAELTRQMEAVADGHVTAREVVPGKDELNQMDHAMQELCMSLSIRDYEVDGTVRSYRRFIPEKLPELLDRANLTEVELGDSRRIFGNVGLFSVGNRDEARGLLNDDDFVEFINYTFDLFQTSVRENRGCMISSGLRLSALDTLFPEDPVDGVKAGLDFLGQSQKRPVQELPAPKPVLMLHRTSILYGVAGQADRLYPYLSSSELEFLGGFALRFYEAGTRIVATEAYWSQLKDKGYTGRYIGFVSDGERATYKLYEVLDALPELERKLRQGYDQRLQEAINLFYHNDFFLARNLFSALLRVCPEDGIVRWYLFACEHFFNQEGEFEPDYRLFGVNEVS